MEWNESPPEDILHVFNRLGDAETWESTRAILEQEQQVLLTNHAESMLISGIEEARLSDDEETQAAITPMHHLYELLQRAQAVGMGVACDELEATLRRDILQTAQERQLLELLDTWLKLSGVRIHRRFLEEHPELLASTCQEWLRSFIRREGEDDEDVEVLSFRLELLQEAQERGGTTQAIRETYINRAGGFALDLPSWLEEIEAQVASVEDEALSVEEQAQLAEQLYDAIERAKFDSAVHSTITADLRFQLAILLRRTEGEERAQALEQTIRLFELTLYAFTLSQYPLQYALSMFHLAEMYQQRIYLTRSLNIEQALTAYEEAQKGFSRERFPEQWAAIQGKLGHAYVGRLMGQQEENLEQAITYCKTLQEVIASHSQSLLMLSVHETLALAYEKRTKGTYEENIERVIEHFEELLVTLDAKEWPIEWAAYRVRLARAYYNRRQGERKENLERAIYLLHDASHVYTQEMFPTRWAHLQLILSDYYRERVNGERRANIEQSITYCQAALQVYTRDDYPFSWAATQRNLGITYSVRIEGEQQDNIEEAIFHSQEALSVYSYEAHPVQWASVQCNLSDFYRTRITGVRWANIEEAIAYAKAALLVYTSEEYAIQWGTVQSSLGLNFLERVAHERSDNIEQALAYLRAAEQIFTRENHLSSWIGMQINFSLAYLQRIKGERSENLEHAYTHLVLALPSCRSEAFPLQWINIHNNLAEFYRLRVEGNKQENLEKALAHCEDALRWCTRETLPVLWAMLQLSKGNIYQLLAGDKGDNLDNAIVHYMNALLVCSITTAPADYAKVMTNLGMTYVMHPGADKQLNIMRAIMSLEASLQFYTREAFPMEWANVQINLGGAFVSRLEGLDGGRSESLERAREHLEAVLEVYTHETNPMAWALAQCNLSAVYTERIKGDKGANAELAIAASKKVLEVLTQDYAPYEWALAQRALGAAYYIRIDGEKRANLEDAIFHQECALRVYTEEDFPSEHMATLLNLGLAYSQRIAGSQRENIEQAIGYLNTVASMCTRERYPLQWAMCQLFFGDIYRMRAEGQKQANLQAAIEYLEDALLELKKDTAPMYYAMAHIGLGNAYIQYVRGEQRTNLERAIEHYGKALEVYTYETVPTGYAGAMLSMAMVYSQRIAGSREDNLDKAIECCNEALRVYTYEALRREWARGQMILGVCYLQTAKHMQRSAFHLQEALKVYTKEDAPNEWMVTHQYLAIGALNITDPEVKRQSLHYCEEVLEEVYAREANPELRALTMLVMGLLLISLSDDRNSLYRERARGLFASGLAVFTIDAWPTVHRRMQYAVAQIAMLEERWHDAHVALEGAYTAEKLLINLGVGLGGLDVVLKEGQGLAALHSTVLLRLGRLEDAAIVLERGRAINLAEALALEAGDAGLILNPERRKRYEQARNAFKEAQVQQLKALRLDQIERDWRAEEVVKNESYANAKDDFDLIVKEIRAARDPTYFLEDTLNAQTLLHAAASCDTAHALVYLAVAPQGGLALAVLGGEGDKHFVAYEFPRLTIDLITHLLVETLDDEPSGGYLLALFGSQESIIDSVTREKRSWREFATMAYERSAVIGKMGMLVQAAYTVLQEHTLAAVVDQPLETLRKKRVKELWSKTNDLFLKLELRRWMSTLADVALNSLIQNLLALGVQSLTLIPCGPLAIFPLATIPLADGRTIGETLPTSVAPSARSLLTGKPKHERQNRSGVYAIGNPARKRANRLPESEKEAQVFVRVARDLALPADVKVQEEATRDWLVEKLREGIVVDAACHGHIELEDFLASSLLLANKDEITLRDLLGGQVDIRGLRLLILSACETAIMDINGAIDEVRSIASGMVQAGAHAVIASSWSVDDEATYLLMARFAYVWLPHMEQMPPASALAQAQQWLRTVTYQQLQEWRKAHLPEDTTFSSKRSSRSAEQYSMEEEVADEEAQEVLSTRRGSTRPLSVVSGRSTGPLPSINTEPTSCPYEDPFYWAGFQVIGW